MKRVELLVFILSAVLALAQLSFRLTDGKNDELSLSNKMSVFDSKKTTMIGQLVDLASGQQIPMGIEAVFEAEAQPLTPIHIEKTTVKETLERITQRKPEYSWRLTQGVLEIFSSRIRTDPKNFLNLRIPEFKVRNESILEASAELRVGIKMLLHPESYLHGSGGGMGWGFPPPSGFDVRNITLDSKDLSVREILNQIIVSNENALWIVILIPGTMMEHEAFIAQTGFEYPARTGKREFHWDLVPLRAVKKSVER